MGGKGQSGNVRTSAAGSEVAPNSPHAGKGVSRRRFIRLAFVGGASCLTFAITPSSAFGAACCAGTANSCTGSGSNDCSSGSNNACSGANGATSNTCTGTLDNTCTGGSYNVCSGGASSQPNTCNGSASNNCSQTG